MAAANEIREHMEVRAADETMFALDIRSALSAIAAAGEARTAATS